MGARLLLLGAGLALAAGHRATSQLEALGPEGEDWDRDEEAAAAAAAAAGWQPAALPAGLVEVSEQVEVRGGSFPFDPQLFADLGAELPEGAAGCGERLTRRWRVEAAAARAAVQLLDSREAWTRLAPEHLAGAKAVGRMFGGEVHRRTAAFWMAEGHFRGLELRRVGDHVGAAAIRDGLAALEGEGEVEVEGYVGWDLRGCWGNLRDWETQEGRAICGAEAMQAVLAGLPSLAPQLDTRGNSGNTIITNLQGFVVKNAASRTEVDLLLEVAPKAQRYIQQQEAAGRVWSTAIAPICGVVTVPGVAHWLLMRKVSVSGRSVGLKMEGFESKIHDFDLKGPKFASWKDFKTWRTKHIASYRSEKWESRDLGFVKLFPDGLAFAGCGAQDAEATLLQDSRFLAGAAMTDYSFFGALYKTDTRADCSCGRKATPRFPLLLQLGQFPGTRLAVGIIDWIEQTYRSGVVLWFSTMEPPEDYKVSFHRMWGSYFFTTGMAARDSEVAWMKDGQCPMRPAQGDEVTTLEDLSWEARRVEAHGVKVYDAAVKAKEGSIWDVFHRIAPMNLPAGTVGTYQFRMADGRVVIGVRMKKNNKMKYMAVMPGQVMLGSLAAP